MTVRNLIRRARNRYVWNELGGQAAFAASVGMAAVILVLVTGTQLLDWPVAALLSILTLGVGSYRILRRVPSAYAIAQLVDQRLYLADALSTALHFEVSPDKGLESMREAQKAQAERVAENVDLERAVPFVMPRAAYALAALGLVATCLFALRYGMTRTLDLKAPLATILMQTFGSSTVEQAELRKKGGSRRSQQPKPIGLSIPEGDPNQVGQLDPASNTALDTVEEPDAINSPVERQVSAKTKSESAGSEKGEGEQGDPESSEGTDANSGESAKEGAQGDRKSDQNGTAEGGKPELGGSDQNSSLVSKLRDAMSSLISRMKQQSGQRQANTGQDAHQASTQRSGPGQKGASGQGQQQSGSQESTDAENQQAGAEGKNGQNAQAQGGGKSSDQQASSQPGSGIGKQDGNKEARLAEQLAAMGKISEIIGKRSANVTGEISVEVPSNQQPLHTAYSQNNATHSDAGGEISRDEVPVIFQQYVQQYFAQVHKQSSRAETATRSKAQTPGTKTQPPSM
ncbi:MAG: hypothetical protein DMG57_33205 [Acidobacteria bacterium]|nr:MAG: hypothetical protein DMG57_33205 [Acidobacteriota bacterium]